MKKLIYFIAIAFLMSSCSESFLDRQPEDTLAPGSFFNTASDIKTGLIATYQPLQTIFLVDNLPHMLGQMSDDGTRSYNSSIWNTFQKDNSHSAPEIWNTFYKLIVNANNIIDVIDEYVPKNDQEAVTVSAYKGEASFLRALSYFYLVRLYGDVPMVVERFTDPGTAFGIGRTSVNVIYNNVIIPDLEYAFANCYKKGDAALANEGARATKGAALTILGKVYLTMNNHQKAEETLKKLIVDKQGGDYQLLDDYSRIWLPTNKFNSESIFEVNYNFGAGMGSHYYRNMSIAVAYYYGGKAGSGYFNGEKDLMDEFVANGENIRYRVSVDSGYVDNLIQPAPLKLSPPLPECSEYEQTGTDYNYMITRYGDALLMYAEALMFGNKKDEAVTFVNMVRERGGMPPISADDLDLTRIIHERRMELSFEGHRYFDLVRTGKAIEYISRVLMSNNEYEHRAWRITPIPEFQLLLPIPVGEIEKDQTLAQNPGY